MASKLKEAKEGTLTGTRVSSVTLTTEEPKKQSVPKGAKILSKTVRTETEQIENGWLISKHYDIKYQQGDSTDWAWFCKKWYSKTDPLEIKLTDKSLADEFEDE